jgi:hypothetical protein
VIDGTWGLASGYGENFSVYLGAGAIGHDAGKVATDATSSSKPILGDIYTHATLMTFLKVSDFWDLSGDFHYAIPYKKSPEGGETSTIFGGGLRVFYRITNGLDVHLGPGVQFYQINGNGGTVSLNNGSGSSTFAIPSGSSTSRILYLDTGLGVSFGQIRLDSLVLISNLFSSNRRAISPVLNLSVGLF